MTVALLVTACGADHEPGHAGNDVDAAFLGDMIPHHEGAVEMAQIARQRAEHEEVRALADDIIASQRKEVETMESMKETVGDAPGDGHMSGDEHARGMDMDPAELSGARPFDREFLDMMIPHHQGAVMMSWEVIANGENPKLQTLAREMITAQEREIDQMREWRTKWYGKDASAPQGGDGGHHE